MAETSQPLDPRLIKAISHPLRHRVLVLLNEREASPKELAEELQEPIGRVSHHVRALARLGAIRLVRTAPRRGAVEHFYRALIPTWFTDAEWATLPLSTRRSVFGEYLGRIYRDVSGAFERGGFDHARAHVSYTLLDLDDEGIVAVSELLDTTLQRVLEINAECAKRGDDTLALELAMLLFEPRR
jgi:DNA-binding transcriptional ArsR family regulator